MGGIRPELSVGSRASNAMTVHRGFSQHHPASHEPAWRRVFALAQCNASGSVHDVVDDVEAERRQALWGKYLAERDVRFVRRAWQVCERLHARTLARLAATEQRLNE